MIIELESILKSTFSPEQRRQITIDPHIEIKTTSAGIGHTGRRSETAATHPAASRRGIRGVAA